MLLDQLKTWTPSTKAEKEAVLQQLERLLENPYFHKSKRFPVFLRFVVSEALAGQANRAILSGTGARARDQIAHACWILCTTILPS